MSFSNNLDLTKKNSNSSETSLNYLFENVNIKNTNNLKGL